MSEISIHDNVITAYKVFCDRKEIIINTKFQEHNSNENVNVIFEGVEAYHFIGDNMHSILFDITKCSIEQILDEFSFEFESGISYAWPGTWNQSPESCLIYLSEKQCSGWKINCSCGMEGFVIAKKMNLKSCTTE